MELPERHATAVADFVIRAKCESRKHERMKSRKDQSIRMSVFAFSYFRDSPADGIDTRPQACTRTYPPAIAPTIQKGSAPDATASGSGVSGGSCDRSCSHAKK